MQATVTATNPSPVKVRIIKFFIDKPRLSHVVSASCRIRPRTENPLHIIGENDFPVQQKSCQLQEFILIVHKYLICPVMDSVYQNLDFLIDEFRSLLAIRLAEFIASGTCRIIVRDSADLVAHSIIHHHGIC